MGNLRHNSIKGVNLTSVFYSDEVYSARKTLVFLALPDLWCPIFSEYGLKRFKEVIAFVIDYDEGREVFHIDFPDGFHTKVFEIVHFNFGDVVFSQNCSRPANRTKVTSRDLLPFARLTIVPPSFWNGPT